MKDHMKKLFSFIMLHTKPLTGKNSSTLVLITYVDILKRMIQIVIYHEFLSKKYMSKCLKKSNMLFDKEVIFQKFLL